MSVWPIIALLVGGLVVLGVLAAAVAGGERLGRWLGRGRTRRDDDGGAGGGELFGDQGLIARGRGEDLYPRDRDR